MNRNSFDENLSRGLLAEAAVATWLQNERGALVRRVLSNADDARGPRLRGRAGEEYILPDLDVCFLDGRREWWEVKAYSTTGWLGMAGSATHWMSIAEHRDFKRVQSITGARVVLCVAELQSPSDGRDTDDWAPGTHGRPGWHDDPLLVFGYTDELHGEEVPGTGRFTFYRWSFRNRVPAPWLPHGVFVIPPL